MATDRQILTGANIAASAPLKLATNATAQGSALHQAEQRLFTCWVLLANEATAATNTDQAFMRTDRALRLLDCRYLPTAALTANDSNFKTVQVQYNNDAGGGLTSVASQTTKITGGSGNWTANQSVPITLAATPEISAASQLHFTTTASGTGVVVPAGMIELIWEEI